MVGEAEFDETGARGHLCACCRHRRDGSNCMGPRLRKLQTNAAEEETKSAHPLRLHGASFLRLHEQMLPRRRQSPPRSHHPERCGRESTHGSSRTSSDINEKHWEVEPSAVVFMCRKETPRHVQQKKIKNLPQRLYVSVPQRTTTRGDAKTADMIPFFSSKDHSYKLPLKTTV